MSDSPVLTCEEAIRLLASYLDDELEQGKRSELETHLDICKSCFSRREFERGLKDQLSETGDEAVSPQFEARIRSLMDRFATKSGGPDST
jgi:anti-sigma factor (TIGR02949 family)